MAAFGPVDYGNELPRIPRMFDFPLILPPFKYILQMQTDIIGTAIEQCGHLLLAQSNCFTPDSYLNSRLAAIALVDNYLII